MSLWPRVCQRTNRAPFTSPPLWGLSRELRVRTAVKNQEQTSSSHCSLTRLWVRFWSAAAHPSSSIRVSWCLCRPPSRSDACPLLLFPLPRRQLRTSISRLSPPQFQEGRATLRAVSMALSMSSLCVLSCPPSLCLPPGASHILHCGLVILLAFLTALVCICTARTGHIPLQS